MAWSKNMDWQPYYRIPKRLPSDYLRRLNVDKKPVSRKYLDELVEAHLTKIPFENLDVTDFHAPVSIEPEKLLQKILDKNRGGFCFELNGAFYLLLRSLGFQAWLCPCRQLRHAEPCPVPATHCGILVSMDGKTLFCDVGYGGPTPSKSMEVTPDFVQSSDHADFCFLTYQETADEAQEWSGWYTLIRQSQHTNNRLPLMRVAPVHCYLSDFYGQSLLRSCGDTAYSVRHVSIKTQDGFADLTGNILTISQNGKTTKDVIADKALPEILRRYFHISVILR